MGVEEITKNKVERKLRENKVKDNTEHRPVGSNRIAREKERCKYSTKKATFGTVGRDTE